MVRRWKVEKLEVEAECFTEDRRGGEALYEMVIEVLAKAKRREGVDDV